MEWVAGGMAHKQNDVHVYFIIWWDDDDADVEWDTVEYILHICVYTYTYEAEFSMIVVLCLNIIDFYLRNANEL